LEQIVFAITFTVAKASLIDLSHMASKVEPKSFFNHRYYSAALVNSDETSFVIYSRYHFRSHLAYLQILGLHYSNFSIIQFFLIIAHICQLNFAAAKSKSLAGIYSQLYYQLLSTDLHILSD
jgi:hypothetical protein